MTKARSLNSRWRAEHTRYSAARMVDDETRGDSVDELTWVSRRKEADGWKNGAKVRKP